jgi:predicted dehydrogenase
VVDTAEFVCGPITAVRGAVFATVIPERALPLGNVVGHAKAALSDTREPVENEDVATFTATFASGAAATFSASRVAYGLPNSLGFELFAEKGAATFDQARPAEFGYVDGSPASAVQGYRQVLVGPEHPYLQGGLAMDFPSVGFGQNDLFVFQARAFLEQVAGVGELPPVPSFTHGLRNLRLLAAVAESARTGGAEVAVPTS